MTTKGLVLLIVVTFGVLVCSELVCIDDVCENDTDVPESDSFLGMKFAYEYSLQKLQKESHVDKDQYGVFVDPMPLQHCELIDFNEDVFEQFTGTEIPFPIEQHDLFAHLCAQSVPPGAIPFAHRYGGLQFAVWAELGDGRALSWGILQPKDHTPMASVSSIWDFQLKGTGLTPYSRDGDGRAVLRSSIREYLGSWAMYNLGAPTTLVPAIVRDANPMIQRDPLYDGNFVTEHAAITLRISPTWLRFGSFQLLHKEGNHKGKRKLIAYTVDNYFSFLLQPGESGEALFDSQSSPRALEVCTHMFNEIVLRTAKMIAHWKALGFCHGVMNTDNMSIFGLTLDYGPFGFMDTFDLEWKCNYSDENGRYRFSNQENVGMWNLKQFADSLDPYVSIPGQVRALGDYFPQFKETYTALMSLRLGFDPSVVLPVDETLIDALLELIEGVDYNYFFRVLATNMSSSVVPPRAITDLLTERNAELFTGGWWKLMDKRRELSGLSVKKQRRNMLKYNPIYILRNHIAEKAIQDAIDGDFNTVRSLRRVLKNPFKKDESLSPEDQKFFSSPPDPNSPPVIVSCSS